MIAIITGCFASSKTYRLMENPFSYKISKCKTIIILICVNFYVAIFWWILSENNYKKVIHLMKKISIPELVVLAIIYGVLYYGLFGILPHIFYRVGLLSS